MKKLGNVVISVMLMMILVLSGCANQTKPKDNQATAIINVSDKVLDEMEGPPKNGHTLERHVGKTEEQLKERLRTDNVSAASTYYDKETATKASKRYDKAA